MCGQCRPCSCKIRELNAPIHPVGKADKDKVMKLAEIAQEVESCSACYGYLLPALDMLDREGLLKDFPGKDLYWAGVSRTDRGTGCGKLYFRIPAQSERMSAYRNRNV